MTQGETKITVNVADGPQVKAVLEAAADLAGGVRSFLSSLPYMAPEMVGVQAQAKLAEPLAELEEATANAIR